MTPLLQEAFNKAAALPEDEQNSIAWMVITELDADVHWTHAFVDTPLLQEAFNRLMALPEDEQDRLAKFILAELESDARWKALFAASPDVLERLVDEVKAERG